VAGLDDENFTEIVSGALQAGDLVIVSGSTSTANTSAVPPPRL
jgi:hypothetical protein